MLSWVLYLASWSNLPPKLSFHQHPHQTILHVRHFLSVHRFQNRRNEFSTKSPILPDFAPDISGRKILSISKVKLFKIFYGKNFTFCKIAFLSFEWNSISRAVNSACSSRTSNFENGFILKNIESFKGLKVHFF